MDWLTHLELTTETFLEIAIDIWSEWQLNPYHVNILYEGVMLSLEKKFALYIAFMKWFISGTVKFMFPCIKNFVAESKMFVVMKRDNCINTNKAEILESSFFLVGSSLTNIMSM